MTVKLMAALVRCGKAGGELATARSGRRCVVKVEVNEEMGRSSGGPRGGFYRGRGGGVRSGKAVKRPIVNTPLNSSVLAQEYATKYIQLIASR
jgi:hypothetical protein